MTKVADVDRDGMLDIVRASPTQWEQGTAVALRAPAPRRPRPRAVIVVGMGGSGIAGDVARLGAERFGRAPVWPVKGYRLPSWAGPDTPVLAVSHSGNTEETLAAVGAAIVRGIDVHAVTTGGELGELATAGKCSVTTIDGGLQPRASLPSLVPPVLVALQQWDVLDGVEEALASVALATRAVADADLGGESRPRQLARAVQGTVPVFLGGRGVGSLVALRGAAQVAENAKEPSFASELPEFDHNALVGFATRAPDNPFTLVAIRDPREHDRINARFQPTLEGVMAGVRAVEHLHLPDGDWLTRLACGILEVDLLSVHLALALERDPTPVEPIVALKQILAGDA